MNYILFKVTVMLEIGEKMIFRITAKHIDEAKSHVKHYLNKKGRQINSIRCVAVNKIH